MPFNCTITTDENATHPDGTRHMRIEVSGPPHSGKDTIIGMLSEFYVRKGMTTRVYPNGEDPSHPMNASIDRCTATPQVVIVAKQLARSPAGPDANTLHAYQHVKDSMGGGNGPMPVVYTDERAAQLWAEDHKEEWTSYKIIPVKVRILNAQEGAVGQQLVRIDRTRADDMLLARARKKLTDEEHAAIIRGVVSPPTTPVPGGNTE